MADLSSWPATEALGTQRLDLEPLRVAHAEEMALVLDDVALRTWIGGHPATAQELAARYARQVIGRSPDGSQRWCSWVIRQRTSSCALGYVQASLEVGEDDQAGVVADAAWVVALAAQGEGLATEASDAMLTWLRDRGARRVVAYIHPEHTTSTTVAGRLGPRPTDVIVDGELRWTS